LAGRLRSSTDPNRIFKAVRSVVDASGVLARKHHRVLDSTILDEAVGADGLDPDQQDAVGLFALVAAQDVEPGEEESTWRVARRVAKDRVISTVDPRARHDDKSMSVRKDGFQAHLSIAPHTGIVTAARITPANTPGGPVRVELVAAKRTGLEILADPAHESGATRTALRDKHHRLVIKPMPFHGASSLDHDARAVTCPVGRRQPLHDRGVARFAPRCASGPARSRCTTAPARSFSVGPHDAELVAARAAWHDDRVLDPRAGPRGDKEGTTPAVSK
jgi:hypothetical protein